VNLHVDTFIVCRLPRHVISAGQDGGLAAAWGGELGEWAWWVPDCDGVLKF